MNFLIDIGNSTIKLAYHQGLEIKKFLTISSKELISEKHLYQIIETKLKELAFTFLDFKLICLTSVRPMWDDLFNQLAVDLNLPFYQVKKNLKTPRLTIDLPNPRNIGSDLLVGCYGVVTSYLVQNSLLVNMGTATTISLIKNQKFIGTIIMPGLEISADALFAHAQLLQKFEYSFEKKYIGHNTKQAINLGVVNSHGFAIEKFVNDLKHNVTDLAVILTGGNSGFLKDYLKTYQYDELVLFKGLVAILKDNNLE